MDTEEPMFWISEPEMLELLEGKKEVLTRVKERTYRDNGIFIQCSAKGCNKPARFQGWYEDVDFSGNKTGTVTMIKVCKDHVHLLKGWDKYKGG